jgi:hypothetical protein
MNDGELWRPFLLRGWQLGYAMEGAVVYVGVFWGRAIGLGEGFGMIAADFKIL